MRIKFLANVVAIAATSLFGGCRHGPATVSGRLPQRGYLWQRQWTPAVSTAFAEADRRLAGVVLLGAEIEWRSGQPKVVRANIDWARLRVSKSPCAIALRVAPFAFPKSPDDLALRSITAVAGSLLSEARTNGIHVQEFQLDYDCAQNNLDAYGRWLRDFRETVHPTRFVITTLPSWLDDEAHFHAVIDAADGYVLQVHSVPLQGGGDALCDVARARRWVARAAKLGRAFSIALPTYRCTAGYDRTGQLIGVAMDSVQPAWPPETRTMEFAADANALAGLVKEWEHRRPAELRELIWYRIPVGTDKRNWRWPTLAAVMAGREPANHLAVVRSEGNPIDLSLINEGETDEELHSAITASWHGDELVAADALAGWQVESGPGEARFSIAPGRRLRLPPGATRRIGWLRYVGAGQPTLHYEDGNPDTR